MLGGVLYTGSMVFFVPVWPQVFSYHEVFHVFVVAGSAVHYVMTFQRVSRFGDLWINFTFESGGMGWLRRR